MSDRPETGAAILVRHELGASLRTFLAWLVPMACLLGLTCALQPSFAGDGGALAAKIQAMPETLRKAFGVELVDFRRPAAYLAINFLSVTLIASLFGGLLGARIVAKEETLHTAELLYAQPVSRVHILAGKAAAVAVYAIALPLALGLLAVAILAAVVPGPLEAGLMAALFGGAAALSVCFAGAGMLVAAVVRDARSAAGGALAIVLGTYFLGVLSAIAAPAAPLRWLSPYKLVEPIAILARGGLDPVGPAALVALGIAFAAAGIARHRRRDILA